MCSVQSPPSESTRTLVNACLSCHVSKVREVLDCPDCDVNWESYEFKGRTPLICALVRWERFPDVDEGRVLEILHLLADARADLNFETGRWGTALEFATGWGKVPILRDGGIHTLTDPLSGKTLEVHRDPWENRIALALLGRGADPQIRPRQARPPSRGAQGGVATEDAIPRCVTDEVLMRAKQIEEERLVATGSQLVFVWPEEGGVVLRSLAGDVLAELPCATYAKLNLGDLWIALGADLQRARLLDGSSGQRLDGGDLLNMLEALGHADRASTTRTGHVHATD